MRGGVSTILEEGSIPKNMIVKNKNSITKLLDVEVQ